ncbi:MAG: hypothetical protein D6743_14665 [Calditrichaeota bacterium]|nr:MAG: hypothetical protein D6743_14665 [Calditrichota bacterium]
MRRLLRLLILAILPASATLAQQGSISIDSHVDKSSITIGDLITYSVVVTRSPDVQVEMPELGANLGSFEIRDYQVHEPQKQDGQVVEQVDYVISTFDVGEFEIPPLTFYYTLPGDSTRHQLKTRKIDIVVESMKPSKAGDIRDIKAPLDLPRDYRKLIIWGSIGFATLVLGLLAFYIWRRRRAGKGLLPEKVEPPRPAHEVALEALTALQNSELLAEGKVKEFYIRISEIIRKYIEGRYFIVALELTTFELTQALREAEIEPEDIERIHDFLAACDLVKFAKYVPTAQENQAVLEDAFAIVERTKLLYDQPEPAGEQEEPTEAETVEQTEECAEEHVEDKP